MHKTTININKKAAWNYYDNQKNTSEAFSKEEQDSWNKQKKDASDKK